MGGGGATAASGMRIRRFGGIRIAMAGRQAGGWTARKDEARKEGRSVGGAGAGARRIYQGAKADPS